MHSEGVQIFMCSKHSIDNIQTVQEAKHLLESINVNASIISVIIEREHTGDLDVLVQTRWKPEKDPQYSGTLEIPQEGFTPMKMSMMQLKEKFWKKRDYK